MRAPARQMRLVQPTRVVTRPGGRACGHVRHKVNADRGRECERLGAAGLGWALGGDGEVGEDRAEHIV